MLNPRDCVHGSLARSCELCERDEELHELRVEMARLRKRLRRLEDVAFAALLTEVILALALGVVVWT